MDKMKWLPANGIHGYWNDMNEPALGGSYLPDNLLFDFDGRKANALEAKNIYGFQMARSSYEAALQNAKDRRPFILTRSGFAGVQRYAAVWSGDNTTSDDGLLSSVLLNNQMGLSGISFCGYDIGGFIGSGSKELYTRWIEAGVFSPFCRNHKGCGEAAGEPWAYGDEAEAISKNYIELRYRLLPYLYAAFYEASQTGMPVARSLCINYPYDDKVYDNTYQHQFLFGDNILVAPVTSKETVKQLYLPKGKWYNLFSDVVTEGNSELTQQVPVYEIPLYAKASAIIPMQTTVQSTKEPAADTLFIHVFNGTETNRFVLYEDAGDGMQYSNGSYCRKEIVFNPAQQQIQIQSQQGSYVSHYKKLQLVLHGFESSMKKVTLNGSELQLTDANIKIIDGLRYLDAVYEKNYLSSLKANEKVQQQKTVTISNTTGAITVQW